MLGLVRRLLTTSLLLLALAGIVSGNLLRPCDCGSGEDGDPHALCQSGPTTHTALTSCCGCGGSSLEKESDGSEGAGDEDGCTLCCKPRPPLTEAASTVKLTDAHVVAIATVAELPSSVAIPAQQHSWTLSHERRTTDQWLLSPEGLALFLI